MRVTESELREQYRNAADEELVLFAHQGSSKYTDTAWALLREEMTRRGLSPTPVIQDPESAEERPTGKGAVGLPLRRWGEVPDPDRLEGFEEPAEPAELEPETEDLTRHVARPLFTGRGDEYFRIWIVNLLFTMMTLGLYSAWAKVRKVTYFRHNTRLEGHVFDYHGNPAAILRGRLLAVVLLAAYTWAFQFSNAAGLLTVATVGAVGPWLFMRAQQFTLANTSFRGLRFGFVARTGEAYSTLLPVLALWLSPTVAAALAIDEGWLFGAPTLALPWMHHRLKAYQRRNATYGDRRFTFTPAAARFYGVYAKGLGLVFLGGVLASGALLLLAAMLREAGPTVGSSTIEALIYGGVAALLVFVVAWPYYAARLQQVVWTRTRLGPLAFHTEIQAVPLFRLVLKNVTLTLLTAGVYWPWAAVALARYRVECMRIESATPLSSLAAGVQARSVSATGEGATDAFGIDIGL